ncbi:hypothetical protein [Streptomyces sp. NPDC060010]|uniref:hypothetical protein n=1 Tax=Streptomyces sp. NPDC060010 TaxID=3347036 RepID=UPI00367CC430
MKSSPYVEALGATGHAPVLDVLAQRLADMRQQRVPERVAQIKDARDERKMGEHHGVAQRAPGRSPATATEAAGTGTGRSPGSGGADTAAEGAEGTARIVAGAVGTGGSAVPVVSGGCRTEVVGVP